MANYIKSMQRALSLECVRTSARNVATRSFRAHLASPKFRTDTTIQVGDVNNWLDTIDQQAEEAVQAAERLMDTPEGHWFSSVTLTSREDLMALVKATVAGKWADVRVALDGLSGYVLGMLPEDMLADYRLALGSGPMAAKLVDGNGWNA